MKVSKWLIATGATVFLILLIGCASIREPVGLATVTTIQIPPEKYEIISADEVEGRSSDFMILPVLGVGGASGGLFGMGGGISIGFSGSGIAAYDEAISKVPNANTLINAKIFTKVFNFLGLFEIDTTIVRGMPAKIKP